jgi:hypothetical protein
MCTTAATTDHDQPLRQLDESSISRARWKIMFISGMGFFTDACDPLIIGVAMRLALTVGSA